MTYIGNQPANSFTSFDSQSLTGNGTAGPYALSASVSSANEIEVFVNFVRQRPGVAYTVAGNQLTMTGNVASTDDFYVVYQGKAVQTVVPPDGSVSGAKLATGAAATNLGSSVNLSTIKDSTGNTTAMTIDSSGRILTPARPAFSCRPNGAMNFINQPYWKTTVFQTVDFDIGSNLNAGGYFVCPVTGIYQFNYHVRLDLVGTSYIIIALSSTLSGNAPDASESLYLNTYVINGSPSGSYHTLTSSALVQLTAGTNVMPWHYSADTSYSIKVASHYSGFLVG